MDKVIIDTSAWIESFRPDSAKSFQHLVKGLLHRDKNFDMIAQKTKLIILR
ncbi:hypothetical protein D1BOALGB6SA_7174 [Olavius sp. associated proteobacterium Delta 1]|nr:hypothetical protein D1BOALGB6SA_7174 [Olavius sp. associated proteobacterium Delta 1]